MKTTHELTKQLQAASLLLSHLSTFEDRHVMIMSNLTKSSIDDILRDLSAFSFGQIDLEDVYSKTKNVIEDMWNISEYAQKIKLPDVEIITFFLQLSASQLEQRLDGDLVFFTPSGANVALI